MDECLPNRRYATPASLGAARGVRDTFGLTFHVATPLQDSVLKECGLEGSATWFVAEGADEVRARRACRSPKRWTSVCWPTA
jgi:hypothetical protein